MSRPTSQSRRTVPGAGSCCLGIALAIVASGSALGGTLVVGPAAGPGVDFTSITAAAQAAVFGDTIYVRAGTYGAREMVPPGKSLTIIGAGGAQTTIGAISGLPGFVEPQANTRTVLRGFRILTSYEVVPFVTTLVFPPIYFTSAADVLIEDCVLVGGAKSTGAFVNNGVRVVFSRCEIRGGDGTADFTSTTPGIPGVDVRASSVELHHCTVRGGRGANELTGFGPGSSGASGIVASLGSNVRAFGCDFTGGDAGSGSPSGGGDGSGDPGSGALLEDASTLTHQGSSFSSGIEPPGVTTPQPAPILIEAGSNAVTQPGIPGKFLTEGLVNPGQTLNLHLEAAPNAGVAILMGVGFLPMNVPGYLGSLCIPPGALIVGAVTTLPGTGSLDIPVVAPSLPGGAETLSVVLQLAIAPPAPAAWAFSNPTSVTLALPGL